MVHIPFWLRDLLKRFAQYIGVFLASLPAGTVYLLLLPMTGNTVALIATLPLGLLCSYFVWNFIGTHFLPKVASNPMVSFQAFSGTETSTQYTLYSQDIVLAGGMAVVVLATCVVATQIRNNAPVSAGNGSDISVL